MLVCIVVLHLVRTSAAVADHFWAHASALRSASLHHLGHPVGGK